MSIVIVSMFESSDGGGDVNAVDSAGGDVSKAEVAVEVSAGGGGESARAGSAGNST